MFNRYERAGIRKKTGHSLLFLVSVHLLMASLLFQVTAQCVKDPKLAEQEMTLDHVLYVFPVLELTLANEGVIYNQVTPVEADFQMEEEPIPLSMTIAVPNLELIPNQEGDLVLTNIKHVVAYDSGELKEVAFLHSFPHENEEPCRMVVVIENGHVTITCDGECPEEKPNCSTTVKGLLSSTKIQPQGESKEGGKEDKVKCKLTCGCKPDTPEEGIRINNRTFLQFSALAYKLEAPNFKTFAGTSGFMLISGIKEMIFLEDGLLDKIVFTESGQQQSSECGMIVEVNGGQTKITCEGTCDEENPYCRMNITIFEVSPMDGEEPPEEEEEEPSGNLKYKIECVCKDS